MISGFYTPDVNTIEDAGTWIASNDEASQMPVCLVCASSKDTYTVEVSDDGGSTWTTIADLDASAGLALDWMFYVTKKNAQVKTTGTGFLRVQGTLVAKT